MSLSLRQYRASVRDYLRDGYGATEFKIVGGGNHSKLQFLLPNGARGSLLLNDRNGAGGSNAADLKLQDIRRTFGEPTYPTTGTKSKRTLTAMTEELHRAARALPNGIAGAGHGYVSAPGPDRHGSVPALWNGSVSLNIQKSNQRVKTPIKILCIYPPAECIEAFYADLPADAPRGTTVGFTKPDLWTLRHGDDEARALKPGNSLVLGGATYVKHFGGLFASTPATFELIAGRLEIRLAAAPIVYPVPVALAAAPVGASALDAPETPQIIEDDVPTRPATSLHDRMRAVLREVNEIETLGERRLRRVKIDGGERWVWRAPDVTLERGGC